MLFTAVGIVSCADSSPTGPVAPATAQNGLLSGLIGDALNPVTAVVGFIADATDIPIYPVKWGPARKAVSYSVSGTIMPWGGTLTIPEADFTITFPYGAVSEPTAIKITSDSRYVAYKMEPRGITFAAPVVVTQGLQNTVVYGQPLSGQLFGAYIPDDRLDLKRLIYALEIEISTTIFAPGSTLFPQTEVWIINHFSRYILASG